MVNSTVADIVSNDETIIRYLKKRYYDTATQQWSTDTFELRKGEDNISVCRENLLNSIEDGAKLSFPKKMWKCIIAYTSLEVNKVRGLSTQEITVDVIPVAIEYDSLINIRPRQNNRSRDVENPEIRKKIADITNSLIVE